MTSRGILLLPVVLAACHTPAWRVAQIHEEIDAVNAPRKDAAVKSALEANHATLLSDAQPTTVMFRSDMNECPDAESVIETAEHQVLVVPCNALRNALFTSGAVSAKSEDGSRSFVLVSANPPTGDTSLASVLAQGLSGELYVIRPHINVVRRRKIWREGTCNFMPSPVQLTRMASMFVLPADRASTVRTIDVTYDGEETDVVCDQRVE